MKCSNEFENPFRRQYNHSRDEIRLYTVPSYEKRYYKVIFKIPNKTNATVVDDLILDNGRIPLT